MGLTRSLAHSATAPLRVGLVAGELALEVALGVVRGTRRALDGNGPSREPVAPDFPPAPPADVASRVTPVPRRRTAVPRTQPPPSAEDAAGAQVRIDEPWDGYDAMTAAQIAERLAKANREVVAAVTLYEGSGRGRRSVIRAADRRLRLLSA